MTHTPTGKHELVSVVCENLYISLDKSRCLDVHNTGAPAPCNVLVLLPSPSTQHVGDPRVNKLTVLEISMTCVVNGVRHTSRCDALTQAGCAHLFPLGQSINLLLCVGALPVFQTILVISHVPASRPHRSQSPPSTPLCQPPQGAT